MTSNRRESYKMGIENNTTEKDIARCIIEIIVSVLNIAVIYIVAKGGVYALEIPFLIIRNC